MQISLELLTWRQLIGGVFLQEAEYGDYAELIRCKVGSKSNLVIHQWRGDDLG
jgi:hypothetical protein